MREIPKQLLSELTLISQRIQCGESFNTALAGASSIKVNPSIAADWKQVVEKIQTGQASSLSALDYFIKSLKTENDCVKLFKKKSLTPQIELYTISALIILFNSFSFWQHPPSLNEGLLFMSLLVTLISCAFFSAHLLKKDFARGLIKLGWIQLLVKIAFNTKMGKGFPQSLNQALEISDPHLSKKTKEALREDLENLSKGNFNKLSAITTSSANKQEVMQWSAIVKNYIRGTPLLPNLEQFIKFNSAELKDELDSKGERLSFLMLLPTFLFLVPAFFLSIARPLWSYLTFL
ncbi:hypothetical protein GW915_11100 [bacterium]|nr:hypothetical protein [bacterium]